jgi:long-subunit fatty acid transport protein
MEKRVRRFLLPPTLLIICLLAVLPVSAQLVLGQYEDEAPLRTWNIFGNPSAASLALGGVQFARASDNSVSLTNPALLVSLPRYSATLTASYTTASMFKFSLVNTGVVSSRSNITAGFLGIDFGGLALRWKEWAFAFASSVLEIYGRPEVSVMDVNSLYELSLIQEGFLRSFHLGLARHVAGGFSAGLGINVVTGHLRRTLVEQEPQPTGTITRTDDKEESYRGFFLNGGISWDISGRLTAALVFRTPYDKKAKASSLLRYEAPAGGTDIQISAEATNEYRQPWVLGTGWSYRPAERWAVSADLAFFQWSRYRVTYFDEPRDRPFRDTLKAGAGVEYAAPGRLFGTRVVIPFRVGVCYDPQPMKEPRSSYLTFSAGLGFRLAFLAADLAGFLGRESGSGNGLHAGKVALTVTYISDR